MHYRQAIRTAVQALLLNATDAGERVYRTRKIPHRRAELPAISVYADEESVDDESLSRSPRELQRTVSLVIEGWVSATDDQADDAMDALAEQIEAAMGADFYLGETAADSVLSSTVLTTVEDGDRILGMVALVYDVLYRAVVPAPPASLDDFTTAGVTYNLGNAVHPDEVAEDVVTVQEVA